MLLRVARRPLGGGGVEGACGRRGCEWPGRAVRDRRCGDGKDPRPPWSILVAKPLGILARREAAPSHRWDDAELYGHATSLSRRRRPPVRLAAGPAHGASRRQHL